MDDAKRDLVRAWLIKGRNDLDTARQIGRLPDGHLVGKPVVRGTRLAVEFVLGLIAQGWPEPEIMRNYHLSAEQVRACVAYAQERLNEEKVFAVGR
jgi:uncharacterized protein (DUF433 family)